MTTTVTVVASCDDKTEVVIKVTEANTKYEETIQNGESALFYAYDDRVITIREVPK